MKPLSSLLYFGVAASGSANVHFAFIHLCLQFYLDCRLLFLFAKLRFNFLQEAFLLSPRLILLLSSTWRVLTHCPAGKIEFILQGSNENFATSVLKKNKDQDFPNFLFQLSVARASFPFIFIPERWVAHELLKHSTANSCYTRCCTCPSTVRGFSGNIRCLKRISASHAESKLCKSIFLQS